MALRVSSKSVVGCSVLGQRFVLPQCYLNSCQFSIALYRTFEWRSGEIVHVWCIAATVTAVKHDSINVEYQTSRKEPETILRNSARIWRGTLDQSAWTVNSHVLLWRPCTVHILCSWPWCLFLMHSPDMMLSLTLFSLFKWDCRKFEAMFMIVAPAFLWQITTLSKFEYRVGSIFFPNYSFFQADFHFSAVL